MNYKFDQARKAIEQYENVVFRGGKPRQHRIKVNWDERHHAETEGEIYLHRDLADGKLKSVGFVKIPF